MAHNKNTPNKFLSQNFLTDPRIQQRILDAANISKDDTVLEIGPGQGALTKGLLQRAFKVFAVEKDRRLAEELEREFPNTNLKIITQDILKFDFDSLPKGIKIIGNLPYNISTPIITKVLNYKHLFCSAYFTVQWEFGKRLTADINTKDYGSFSCFSQYQAHIDLLFPISNSSFSPAPKVRSCFIRLVPRKKKELTQKEEILFYKILHAAFKQRRKKIVNTLTSFMDKKNWLALLDKLDIDPQSRAENISLPNYIKITKQLKKGFSLEGRA